MKQGEKSIIGLWKHSLTAIYEPGDFVIKGENIYKVNAEVTGIDPDEDLGKGQYELYPGKKINTKEEYEEVVNNSEIANDQYVSSSALNSILKGVYFGLDSDGIIDSTIDITSSGVITTSADLTLEPSDRILDELMDSDKYPDYNNGSIKVNKNLPEIKQYVGHPDENDIVTRNGAKWICCDREKCKKCWECVRVCGRTKKTVSGELIINNGTNSDPTDINSINEADSESFEKAVNICPYKALSFTTDPAAAQEESNAYASVQTGVVTVPPKELILYGARTYEVPYTTPGTGVWTYQSTNTETERYLSGIVIPSSMYSSMGYNRQVRLQETINTYLNEVTNHIDDADRYANVGDTLPVTPRTTETIESGDTRTTVTTWESYDLTGYSDYVALIICDTTETGSGIGTSLTGLYNDIYNSYNGQGSHYDWNQILGTSASLPDCIQLVDGHVYRTEEVWKWTTTEGSTGYITESYRDKVLSIVEAIDTACKTIGGDEYSSCRITQSAKTINFDRTSWTELKSHRYPNSWTATLDPLNYGLLKDYPIYDYWGYYGQSDNSDPSQFYAWADPQYLDSTMGFGYIHYNLTGNLFCIRIPEECLKYLDTSGLSSNEISELKSTISGTCSGIYGWEESAANQFANHLLGGLYSTIDDLYFYIKKWAYCDYVFNVSYGRFSTTRNPHTDYISGTSEFISSVESVIRNHPYYAKYTDHDGVANDPSQNISISLEDWQNGTRYPADAVCSALLPRVLYSEWVNLCNDMSLDSLEAVAGNDSNLILAPRWINSSLGGDNAFTPDECQSEYRNPFWDDIHDRDTESEASNIDENIKPSADYYNKNFFVASPDSYAILKQYTYVGSDGKKHRVQELVDPEYGEMFVRSSRNLEWKPCIVNQMNTIRKLSRLLSTLDSYRHGYTEAARITNKTYGSSALTTWAKDNAHTWPFSEAIADRHFFMRSNVDNCIFILLVKDSNGKAYNVTITTSRNGIDRDYVINNDVSISVRYSGDLSRVFIICSSGCDLDDIYYGK